MAEPDLADARGGGDGQDGQQEPGQHPALAVVAAAGPAVEPPGEPDGGHEQVERQVQPQRGGRVDPAVQQVVDRPPEVGAGPPGDADGRRRGQPGQGPDRDPPVGQVGDRLRRPAGSAARAGTGPERPRARRPDGRQPGAATASQTTQKHPADDPGVVLVGQGQADRPGGGVEPQRQATRAQVDQPGQQARDGRGRGSNGASSAPSASDPWRANIRTCQGAATTRAIARRQRAGRQARRVRQASQRHGPDASGRRAASRRGDRPGAAGPPAGLTRPNGPTAIRVRPSARPPSRTRRPGRPSPRAHDDVSSATRECQP